jgi:hypothetical protein
MNLRALYLSVATVLAGFAPQEDADKAAAELLKKLDEQVMKAKTLHIEFEAAPAVKGREEKLKGEIKIGEKGAFSFKMTVNNSGGRTEEIALRSDGSVILGNTPGGPVDSSKLSPLIVEKTLRRASSISNLLGAMLFFRRGPSSDDPTGQFVPQDVKSEGTEKVGAIDAKVVSFSIPVQDAPGGGPVNVKLWIDAAALKTLKCSMVAGRETIEETISRFDLNAAFPADYFEFQSATLLKEGLAIQLARSVSLHARFTGRVPKTLDDLARRAADLPASVFWPAGGFWIGGVIPKDFAYSSDATHFTVGSLKERIPPVSPVAAPSDRLKKFFEARVRLQLLKAAAEGYYKSASTLPKDSEGFFKKGDGLKYWPEGGWIAGGTLPPDPWGDAYIIKSGDSFSASVMKSKSHAVKSSDITTEERKGLDEAALPALTPADTADVAGHMKKLGADAMADRDAAMSGILSKGPGALRLVEDRLAVEKEPEIVLRLGQIRDQLRSSKPAWENELKKLWVGFAPVAGSAMMMSMNERMSSVSLKTITTAQADFRSNDRDGNRSNDFWVLDVSHRERGAAGGGAPGRSRMRSIDPTALARPTRRRAMGVPAAGNLPAQA